MGFFLHSSKPTAACGSVSVENYEKANAYIVPIALLSSEIVGTLESSNGKIAL